MARVLAYIAHALPSSDSKPSSTASIIIATALATAASITVARLALAGRKVKIIKSPAATLLPRLSQAEQDALPYPPDAFPGGREVATPYGTLKVFEWGPETGRKVLIVHGITTSTVAVGAIAQGMVDRGCRVMIFDLWGRGYSDSCADLEHDERLYMSQILLVLASSPLPWTGDAGFSLVGYSIGGGIAASFTRYFPRMVGALALVVPAGLIREELLAGQQRLVYFASLLPPSVLEAFVKWRLQAPMFADKKEQELLVKLAADPVAEAEVEAETTPAPAISPASQRYPKITEHDATHWQFQHHAGFVTSFMSTALHFAGSGQHETWRCLGLRSTKTMVIAASDDPIIRADQLREDAAAVLGDKLEWRVIDGAHGIAITAPDQIVKEICDFWGL